MEEIKLKVNEREEIGKEAVKKLRAQGLIPAVVYKSSKSLNIKVPTKGFLEAIHTKAGANVIIKLQVEDSSPKATKSKKSRTAIIKEIQYHPVRGDVLHIDFNEISLTEAIVVKIPIAAKGEAPGVKEGGVLEHILWELEVECLPTQIPENVPVDVSALVIGDSILVKDLSIPQEVKVLTDPEATVIAMAAPHVEKEEEEPLAEGETAEPEVIMEKKPKEEEQEAEETKEAQEKKAE